MVIPFYKVSESISTRRIAERSILSVQIDSYDTIISICIALDWRNSSYDWQYCSMCFVQIKGRPLGDTRCDKFYVRYLYPVMNRDRESNICHNERHICSIKPKTLNQILKICKFWKLFSAISHNIYLFFTKIN